MIKKKRHATAFHYYYQAISTFSWSISCFKGGMIQSYLHDTTSYTNSQFFGCTFFSISYIALAIIHSAQTYNTEKRKIHDNSVTIANHLKGL